MLAPSTLPKAAAQTATKVKTMGLSDKREALVKQLPIIKTVVSKSKDGKWLIHKTEIVHIKPMAYYQAILDNNVQVTEERIDDEIQLALDAIEA